MRQCSAFLHVLREAEVVHTNAVRLLVDRYPARSLGRVYL